MAFRTFEIYLMPFSSYLPDKFGRKTVYNYCYISAFICCLLALTALIVLESTLQMIVSVVTCLLLGGVVSILPTNTTSLLHDRYGSRSKVAFRVGSIFASYKIFLSPIIGMLTTISFGSLNTVIISTVLLSIAFFIKEYALINIPNVKSLDRVKFSDTFTSLFNSLSIKYEKVFIPTLAVINLLMTPFFMVSLPHNAANGIYPIPEFVVLLDMLFGLGVFIANKFISNKIPDKQAILIGLFLLALMLSFGSGDNVYMAPAMLFLGGLGLPLIVINITTIRVNNIPKDKKSMYLSSLTFWSLFLNPISILIISYMYKYDLTNNVQNVYFCISFSILAYFFYNAFTFSTDVINQVKGQENEKNN
ncbi:MFS transporter [Photobacterium sp. GB-36]|uniref:MFS transporter n=2 Tax=unclassified Photobacterium TaxID=2628852 RepID=UPI0011B2944E|nr:MFS transporter [Photobacterium sp. GB-36]